MVSAGGGRDEGDEFAGADEADAADLDAADLSFGDEAPDGLVGGAEVPATSRMRKRLSPLGSMSGAATGAADEADFM
jgi:hypothetical protein